MFTTTLRRLGLAALSGLAIIGYGCGQKDAPPPSSNPTSAPTTQATAIAFEDVTQTAGIDFKHIHGGFGKKWLPETMGSGLAWIDYDGDGYQDVFFVNGREWTAAEKASAKAISVDGLPKTVTGKLYHNRGNGTFEDVTAKAGS